MGKLRYNANTCNLSEKTELKKATNYRVRVPKTLKARNGTTLDMDYEHSFTTELPRASHVWFHRWEGPGYPVVRVTFDQAMNPATIEKMILIPKGAKFPVIAA